MHLKAGLGGPGDGLLGGLLILHGRFLGRLRCQGRMRVVVAAKPGTSFVQACRVVGCRAVLQWGVEDCRAAGRPGLRSVERCVGRAKKFADIQIRDMVPPPRERPPAIERTRVSFVRVCVHCGELVGACSVGVGGACPRIALKIFSRVPHGAEMHKTMDSCGKGLPGGLTMVCKFVDVFESLSRN